MRFVVLKLKSLTSCFPSNKEPPSALLLSTSEKPENGWVRRRNGSRSTGTNRPKSMY